MAKMMDPRPELGFSGKIWAILLEFRPFCLDLGHIAWIWALWQNLGQNRPQRRHSPEDGARGAGWTDVHMDVRTDGWTNGLIPLCSTRLRPLRGCCPKAKLVSKSAHSDLTAAH